MKSTFNQQAGRLAQLGFFVVALFGFSQAAHATLAADHVIENSVSVEYLDGSGTGVNGTATAYTDSDSVQITVNLVQAAPSVANTTTDSLDPVSTNQTVTLLFQVTSNANGLDNYDFENVAFSDVSGTAAATTSVTSTNPGSGTLALGGSSYSGDGTTFGDPLTFDEFGVPSSTSFFVPMDSTSGDDLSGFADGDILVFRATGTTGSATAGDVVCTIDTGGITDGAVVNDTATITIVNPCDTGGAAREVVFGDQIGERQTLEVNIEAGDVTGEVEFNADLNNTNDNDTVALGPISINVIAVDLRVEKFVRNVTDSGFDGSCGTAATFECLTIEDGGSGVTYYAEGVTANPGDVLEYAILLYNVNGQVTAVTGIDPIVLFTTYSDDSARLYPTVTASNGGNLCHTTNGTCTVDDGAGGAPTVVTPTDDDVSGDDFVFFNTTPDPDQVEFAGGDTGTPNAAPTDESTGGQIPASSGTSEANASVFTFRVTVDS